MILPFCISIGIFSISVVGLIIMITVIIIFSGNDYEMLDNCISDCYWEDIC